MGFLSSGELGQKDRNKLQWYKLIILFEKNSNIILNITILLEIKTYIDGFGLFEEISEIFKITKM